MSSDVAIPEIHRDDVLLVIDKPAGLPSQRTKRGEPGVYEILRERETYVGLHHRLDRRASGLLVLSLHKSVNKALTAGFRKHAITRTYIALCEGHVEDASWDWPVDGKRARTDVHALEHRPDGVSVVRCTLHTGRLHQIRQHAAMNGTPLVGDRMYGGDLSRPWDRLGLHAAELSLVHPKTGERCTWSAPLPW